MSAMVDTYREAVQERRERTALLTRAGHSAQEISVRLGVAQRTVTRYRAANRREVVPGGRPGR